MYKSSFSKSITASFTRPANTTAYTAGDVAGTASTHLLTFSGASPSPGGTGVVLSATCNTTANQSTLPTFRLWLFSSSVAATADNAANATTDAELATCLGFIDFDSFTICNAGSGATGNAFAITQAKNIVFTSAAGSVDVYGFLEVTNAYTPVSGEVISVTLHVTQDF